MDNILIVKKSDSEVLHIPQDKVVRIQMVEKEQNRRIVNDDKIWKVSQVVVVCRDEGKEYSFCIDQFTAPDAFDLVTQHFGVVSKWGKVDRDHIIREQDEWTQEAKDAEQAKVTGIPRIPRITEEKIHFLLRWWRALTKPRY